MATNNSINSNIPIQISKGGTNATTMGTTDGTIYYDGTKLVTTATGTSAQVLTSNGSGSAPTYQAAPSGDALVFIQSQTASNAASITFTSNINSTYRTYFVVLSNVLPATGNTTLQMRVSTDGGATYLADANYLGMQPYNAYNATTWTASAVAGGSNQWNVVAAQGNSGVPASGFFYFFDLTNAIRPAYVGLMSFVPNAGTFSQAVIGGTRQANTTVNAFEFFYSSGNIATGTFTVYGVKES